MILTYICDYRIHFNVSLKATSPKTVCELSKLPLCPHDVQ